MMLALPWLLLGVQGILRAARTAYRDYPGFTVFLDWFIGREDWLAWYEGGNERYNPANLLTADFFHAIAILEGWIQRLTALAVANVMFTESLWWGVPFFLLGGIVEGRMFTLHYNVLFDTGTANRKTFAWWLESTFVFWKNWHRKEV